MTEGWICIHRKLKSHWIWKDATKLQWWIDLLIECNYEDKKICIKNRIIECKRGQSVKSLDTWAKEWRTTKKTVLRFFQMLETESMIVRENVHFTTRITICKYDDYQITVNEKETVTTPRSKRKVNGDDPQCNNINNKTNKEVIVKKQELFLETITPFVEMYGKDMCDKFFSYWSEPDKQNLKIKWELEKTWEISRRLNTWASRDRQFQKKPAAIQVNGSDLTPEQQKNIFGEL